MGGSVVNAKRGMFAVTVALLVSLAGPAVAAVDPYGEDPLGIVPFHDSVLQVYTGGQDVWEVWVCNIPDWDVPIDVSTLTTQLNQIVAPYYKWLSGGAYTPLFKVGGVVSSNDVIPTTPGSGFMTRLSGCESRVWSASVNGPEGALVVADGGWGGGYATPGEECPPPFSGCATTFPGNGRMAVVGAGAVAAVAPETQARWLVVAHEIGHALEWSHSYGGGNALPGGLVNQYDNVTDVMSGYELDGLPIGTHAYNRYAAGWIGSNEVGVYRGGTHTYRLEPIGGSGFEMVVIPLSIGFGYSLGLRTATSHDAAIAEPGVEAYSYDTRASACAPFGWPTGYPCFGLDTRIAPVPAPATTTDTTHMRTVGESFTLGGFTLNVLADGEGRTYLRITDGNYLGRFVDDDKNSHQANIEAIAAAGITNGCDPPSNDRYCPSQTVSRAEMAVFLIRALGLSGALPSHLGTFSDVPAGLWYGPSVEKLAQLGITTGHSDGTFKPNGTVTRGEMAAFLARAFQLDTSSPSQGVFSDVAGGVWYVAHAEALRTAGITTGCATNPLRYCPNAAVPRDQMASFLARSLPLIP